MKLHITTESGKTATVEFHDWDTELDQDRAAIRMELADAFGFVYVQDGVKVRLEDEGDDSGNSETTGLKPKEM